MTEYLSTPHGRRLAYRASPGRGPGIVFLGGFRSDMTGTKAQALHDWATAQGRAFLRFDYSGHGASSGAFEEGCIGDWRDDARAAILALTEGPQVLVGSSMGGWIALLLAREMPDRIAALVTIAAAPDFTTRMWDDEMTEADRAALRATGRFLQPSDYAPEPYVFTERLFDDGAANRVLDRPLPLPMPTRLLQGTADTDVPPAVAHALFDHATGPDIRLTLVKDADHRFSSPDCLSLLTSTLADLPERT